MSTKVQKVITLHHHELLSFCGDQDRKLKQIQARLNAKIIPRGNELRLSGSDRDIEKAYGVITGLLEAHRTTRATLTDHQLRHALDEGVDGGKGEIKSLLTDTIDVPRKQAHVTPLTKAQKRYVAAIRERDIVFGIGPAGTGKTYLAVATAVESLVRGQVNRIVLVRPVVEAGERLGFLPGDVAQKIDPYMRPLYDALYEMLEADQVHEFLGNGTIEIAPLAFMRGRTLNSSFVILDEAQNTSVEQMKMFLTRMGYDSKLVITGDVTQMDIPPSKRSGLVQASKILTDVPEIEFIRMTRRDIVRHELVRKILMAYERDGKK